MQKVRPKCRHCDRRIAVKARLLCEPCYYDPPTRDLYPPVSKYGVHSADTYAPSAVPADPTNAPCGSLAKLKVMRQRFERGEGLFHPDDNPVFVGESGIFSTGGGIARPRGWWRYGRDPDPLAEEAHADAR